MRTTDQYEFECVCGAEIKTALRLTTCPACGREIQIDWQGEETKP